MVSGRHKYDYKEIQFCSGSAVTTRAAAIIVVTHCCINPV
jgi:hypothetical protein